MKFAFIVLNYNTAEQTEKCIDSILERAGKIEDFKIGLLDNGSRDCSCRELVERKYKFVGERGGLLFIESKTNLGFAGGNNLMFNEIKKTEFNADFFIFLNNDVYLVSNDFCKQIEFEYKKSNFGVLAPRIILGSGYIDQCPFDLPSEKSVRNEISYWKSANFFSSLHLIKLFLLMVRVKNFVKRVYGQKLKLVNKSDRKENVLLHGACLVFSKTFFDFYKEPFDTRTFLYKEEELLFLRILRKKLISVFLPNLIVFHEGGSSSVKNKNLNQIFKFRAENYLNSLNILLSEIKDYEK